MNAMESRYKSDIRVNYGALLEGIQDVEALLLRNKRKYRGKLPSAREEIYENLDRDTFLQEYNRELRLQRSRTAQSEQSYLVEYNRQVKGDGFNFGRSSALPYLEHYQRLPNVANPDSSQFDLWAKRPQTHSVTHRDTHYSPVRPEYKPVEQEKLNPVKGTKLFHRLKAASSPRRAPLEQKDNQIRVVRQSAGGRVQVIEPTPRKDNNGQRKQQKRYTGFVSHPTGNKLKDNSVSDITQDNNDENEKPSDKIPKHMKFPTEGAEVFDPISRIKSSVGATDRRYITIAKPVEAPIKEGQTDSEKVPSTGLYSQADLGDDNIFNYKYSPQLAKLSERDFRYSLLSLHNTKELCKAALRGKVLPGTQAPVPPEQGFNSTVRNGLRRQSRQSDSTKTSHSNIFEFTQPLTEDGTGEGAWAFTDQLSLDGSERKQHEHEDVQAQGDEDDQGLKVEDDADPNSEKIKNYSNMWEYYITGGEYGNENAQ